MAVEIPVTTTPVAAGTAIQEERSYVDWPAIIAGAVLASAVSLLMMTFGSAIGLSLADPFGRADVSLFWVAIAVAIWIVWVQVSAFLVGGYVTGRMRRRHGDATEHEVDVRDGIHGLLVWATGLVIASLLAFGGLGALANSVSNLAGPAAAAAAGAVGDEAAGADPFDYTIDLLFRGDTGEAGDPRAEVTRILVAGVTGDGVTQADRDYLAGVVASRTGLSQEEAETRVDEVIAQAQRVQADIVAAADQARRIGILVAFLTAASFAVSAAAAYFAAGLGGSHRDKHTVVPFFNRAVRRVSETR